MTIAPDIFAAWMILAFLAGALVMGLALAVLDGRAPRQPPEV